MLLDGTYAMSLYHVAIRKINFFGTVIEIPVVADEPFYTQNMAVKDGKVGDIPVEGNPDIKMTILLPTFFRAEVPGGDILVGTRQLTPGDTSW